MSEQSKVVEVAEVEDCDEGSPCENYECQKCCPHDYDPDEGMMCINCGAEYDW